MEFPDAINIIEEKGYLHEQVLGMKVPYSEEMPQRKREARLGFKEMGVANCSLCKCSWVSDQTAPFVVIANP